MKKVITWDGSETYHNLQYGESYHSISGAQEESIKKFVEPCQLRNLALMSSISILDIGFGLGYNVAAALDCIMKVNKGCMVTIVSLEKDPNCLNLVSQLNPKFEHYGIIRNLVGAPTINNMKIYEQGDIKIMLILNDARLSILELENKFDAVFLDPFSPKKNPDLWSVEFLGSVKNVMHPKGVLATYSCARVVRDNMKKVGFVVKDGPIVGRRAPGTLAYLNICLAF